MSNRRLHLVAPAAAVLAALSCATPAPRAGGPPGGPRTAQAQGWRAFVGCWAEGNERFALDSLMDPRSGYDVGRSDARQARALGENGVPDEMARERATTYWRMVSPDSIKYIVSLGFAGTIRYYAARGDSLIGRSEFFTDVVTRDPNPSHPVRARRIPCPPASQGLILQGGEGERRVRRAGPGSRSGRPTPFMLKVDTFNGGARDLVMVYEEVAPGEAVRHWHLLAEEVVFVHRGSGVAEVGGRTSPVSAGATVFVPRETHVGLRNTGTEPLGIAFILSRPGFEQLLRDGSVREGEPATALAADEQARIEGRNRWHVLAEGSAPDPAGRGTGGLILQAAEGERRVRRPRTGAAPAHLATPFILKVDPLNGGSGELVMGYEEIAPGDAIPPHRHLHAEEIVFVHRGSGVADVGTRQGAVGTGATIFIPRNTRITLRNTGAEPLGIVFVFSKPGFEWMMRESSVPEGQPAPPMSPEEQAAIRARHLWHTIYEP